VAQGSHANYPKPGRHRPYLNLGGLRLTRKDLGLITGSKGRYIDQAPRFEEGVALDGLEAIILRFTEPGEAAMVDHHCAYCDQEESLSVDKYRVCRFDTSWLSHQGRWGALGGFFSGDSAPESIHGQGAWQPFQCLEECEFYDEQDRRKKLATLLGNGARPPSSTCS
jgi:hypothetical protein